MSAVLCLPACLCVSAAASRDQAPHGNASVHLWSFYTRDVRGGGCGLVPPRHALLVFVCARRHTTLALLVPSGLWVACLVAVVCSPVACGSLLSVSLGCPSYHHFFPLGLPIRYSLIPSMFHSAVLAESCSSCVLWRCPYFLRRWRPTECTCSGKEKGVVLVEVTWLVGALAPRFACVSISGGPCCVLSYMHTFWRLRRHICVQVYLLLFLCPWVCGMCVLWRWCALRWRVVPSFRLRAGIPHTMVLSSVRTG